MKVIKYSAIALAIVAVLATVGWFLRNTLIQRISNPILKDYDVEVTDVSLDALTTDNVTISYLELQHANGTTIAIEGLKLPVRTPNNRFKLYLAERVSIITTSSDDEAPFELARLIDQFLSLPDVVAGYDIHITEFNLAPYPAIHDLYWQLSDVEQDLSGSIESNNMSVTITRLDPTTHLVGFGLPSQSPDIAAEYVIRGKLQQSNEGISINGDSILDLPGWEAITKFAGIVPDAIEFRSGTTELLFDIGIPYDVTQPPAVTASLTPTSPLQLGYVGVSGDTTAVGVGSSSAIEITATFPEIVWELRQEKSSLVVSQDGWKDIPVSISNLSCQSGTACSMQTGISMSEAALPIGDAEQIDVSSDIRVSFPADGLRIDVQADAALDVTGFSNPDTHANRIEIRLASAATMEYVDAGWQFAADSIDASVEALSLTDGVDTTAAVFLEHTNISALDSIMSAQSGVFVPPGRLQVNGQLITTPGFRGNVSLQDAIVEIDLATVGLHEDGTIKAQHNLDSGGGQLLVADTSLSFDKSHLSKRITPWRNDWDISAGIIATELQASWDRSKPDPEFKARSSVAIEALAGFYTDTAFAGLSADIDFDYGGTTGLVVEPTTVSIALIEIGLPVENISADVTLDAVDLAVEVENLKMTAFNGIITADPFSFRTGRDTNNLTLRAESLQLEELLTIKEFAAVDVTGTMAAVLPITIEQGGISIEGGYLTGEAPGGVIRYHADSDPDNAATSRIGLVTTALSNFEYESLTSDVTYSKDGDLNLKMQIKGRNPDMDDNRPVVLNLGVENNVPQMLKSLQAARAVEEILEKRLKE